MTPSNALERLGYTERVRELFAPLAEEGLVLARVVRTDRGSLLAATEDGVVRAEHSARFRKAATCAADFPAAGDWVGLRIQNDRERPLVEAVLPRASAFVRADPGKATAGQVLAANVDIVFVVHSLSEQPNLRRIERELALAWESGARPVVVLTKSDVATDPESWREAVQAVAIDVEVHVTSAETGEGVEQLLPYAERNRTVAFIGPSGVGKSTLVNAMLGEERQATREVRVADGKGRHTTVARELLPLPNGGVLIDTPGLRAVALWNAEEGIAASFSDIEELSSRCRFADCSHVDEPRCAVRAAVKAGELPAERIDSYHKMRREQEVLASRMDARAAAEEKRRCRALKGVDRKRDR